MLYFANPAKSQRVRDAMTTGLIGFIDTPGQRKARPPLVAWCADNGCFGSSYVGDDRWFEWLERHAADADTCAFATAPDVVGDAAATLIRSAPFLPRIRALGYPAALVAQDGLESLAVPWDTFDVLFIGGSTEWKLGPHAASLTAEAKRRGKWVHMGRVNSERRFKYARAIGCDSVDGTFLIYGPDANIGRLLAWTRLSDQSPLDFGALA